MSSKNPMLDKIRGSYRKDPQASDQASVSAVEAPLAARDRFRLAEKLDSPSVDSAPLHLVSAPARASQADLPDDTEWSPDYRRWCLENNYKPGSTIEVGLSQVKESPFNPRHFYLARRLEDLIASIAENGQQQPIHVVPDYDRPGEFYLHDGGRRSRALRLLKFAKAKALVVDIPPGIQGYKLGYELNTRREPQSPFDNAVKWKYLIENNHFSSQKELAETLGQDESIVSQTLTIGNLPEEIMLEMISNPERFSVRVAYEVAKFHQDNGQDLEQTKELVERVVRLDMRQRQVIEFRSRFNSERQEADPSGARRARRPRAAPSPQPSPEPVVQRAADQQPANGAAPEEYRSGDGVLNAVLRTEEGGIHLNILGADEAALSAVAQSIRHLLSSIIR